MACIEANRLLSLAQLHRIANANFLDAVKILVEYGWAGDPKNAWDIDAFISLQAHRLMHFIDEYCAIKNLKKLLLNRLGAISKLDVSALELNQNSDIQENAFAQKYSFIDEHTTIKKPTQLEENVSLASKLSPLLKQSCQYEIDLINILSAWRKNKLKLSFDVFFNQLLSGGTIETDTFAVLKHADFSHLAYALQASDFEECCTALQANDVPLFRQHAFALMHTLQQPLYDDFEKFGPFLHFVNAKLQEIKRVNFILVCLKNHIPFNVDQHVSEVEL